MINWKIRFKNKQFWISLISVILLTIQTIYYSLGVNININEVNSILVLLVNAVFSLLAIMGVCIDPTTKGVSDSNKALFYDEVK